MEKYLIKDIMDAMFKEQRGLEDMSVVVDGVKYGITNFKEDTWRDEGKYQYNNEYGTLCSYDEDWNVVEIFDVNLELSLSRSGSYFSDWYYMYDSIKAYTEETVMIPERVIPAHEVTKKVYMEL